MERTIALGIDLGLILSLSVLGYLFLAVAGHAEKSLSTWSLFFGLGAGIFAWMLFILSWLGIGLTQFSVIILFVTVIILLYAVRLRTAPRKASNSSTHETGQTRSSTLLTRSIWVLVISLISAALVLAVTLSYYSWDGIALWGVKGYGIAENGSILAAADYGWTGISFPMNIPIQISLFRIFEGDVLPGSKAIFPIYFASLLVGGYGMMRKFGVRREISAVMMALVGTAPIFFEHATFAYANLPFTFYIVLGALWSIDGIQSDRKRSTRLGGVLLGLAIWTRPEGIPFVIGIIAVLILMYVRHPAQRTLLAQGIAPVIVLTVPWMIFLSQNYTGTEEYELSWIALRGILAGEFHLDGLFKILRYAGGQVFLFRDFGFLLLLCGALALSGLSKLKIRKDLRFNAMFSVGLVLVAVTVGTLYVFAYSPQGVERVSTMLVQAFSRTLMPAGFLFAILGGWTLSQLWESNRPPAMETTDQRRSAVL